VLSVILQFTDLISSNSSYPSKASELNPGFCGVHGAWSLVFCVVFCRSLFLFFFCLLCFLFLDLRILITPLVSPNSSYPFRASKLNPGFCGVHSAWSLVFCVVFCRSLFLFFFCLLCFLFLDLRILITPLVSPNSSYPFRASKLNPGFCGVHGAWSLVFCVVFCRSLFLFFFCLLCFLSLDLRIPITPLVSSNSSCPY
jgi:hypothetical protein